MARFAVHRGCLHAHAACARCIISASCRFAELHLASGVPAGHLEHGAGGGAGAAWGRRGGVAHADCDCSQDGLMGAVRRRPRRRGAAPLQQQHAVPACSLQQRACKRPPVSCPAGALCASLCRLLASFPWLDLSLHRCLVTRSAACCRSLCPLPPPPVLPPPVRLGVHPCTIHAGLVLPDGVPWCHPDGAPLLAPIFLSLNHPEPPCSASSPPLFLCALVDCKPAGFQGSQSRRVAQATMGGMAVGSCAACCCSSCACHCTPLPICAATSGCSSRYLDMQQRGQHV